MDGESLDPQASDWDLKLDDGVDLDDTESVMSDLSTDEFTTDLTTDFRDAMSHIGIPKPFLSLHTLPDFPGGVSIEGIGDINMLLEETQARQIIAHHSEAIMEYDEDGAFLLELDSDAFALDDSIWANIVQGCLDQAARDRNITTPLMVEPWALILLKHGHSYGKARLASSNDFLGNIAIFLPSRHEGGEIVVKDGETENVVFASNQAMQSFSTEDFTVESRPIQSGYVWALIYAVDPHPDLPKLELRPLRHTLRRWIAKDRRSRSQEVIYSPVNCDYKYFNVSKSLLMSEDHYRVHDLQDISAKIPFEIFFASISKKYNYGLALETNQSEKREVYIFGLGGYQITNPRIFVDEKDLVPHTDNEYTAVVIIPRDTILSFFYGTDSLDVVESLFVNYAQACLKRNHAPSAVVVFKQICNFMITHTAEDTDGHWANLTIVPDGLLDILEALCVTKSYSWFSRFGLHYAHDLPKSTFSRLRDRLDMAYLRDKELHKVIEGLLLGVILAYPRPAQQIQAVKAMIGVEQGRSQNGRPRPRLVQIPDYILPFVRQILKACIEACETKQLTAQDGQALVGFSLYFDDPFATLSLIVDKVGLERQPAAILGFVHKVDHYGDAGYLPQEEALQFSQDVTKTLITSTDFAQWRGTADGYYFKRDEDNAMSYVDYYYDEDSDLDDLFYRGAFESGLSKQKRDEKRWQEAKHEGYLHDEYDDHEYPYADSYRNCLYIDKDPLRKHSKDRLEENRYEDLYGISQSSTFSPPGIEEKGVHYRSFYCLFEQLLRPIEQLDEALELLVSTVVNAAPHIPHTEFDTLWIPLAKEFIPYVNIFGELIDTFRESLVAGLLSAILKAYVKTWVGQYPKRPSLVREGVHCSCPDCKGLNIFLADPSLRAGRFKADRTRVQHILDEMTRANVDFKSDMVEDADFITLTVTKTMRLFAQALRQWGNRRYHASKEVAKFGLAGLEFIFGTEWMSFLSMAHLGGVGFDNLEVRTLLRMKTGLSKDFIKARSANMFFRGLPRPATARQVSRLTRKRKWWEIDLSSDIFLNHSHDDDDDVPDAPDNSD
ncbi:hypothetical protein GGI35DRAFT_434909 [Trichoderma velutinum]